MTEAKIPSILDSVIMSGVTVVTAAAGKRSGGMSAAWVTQVSLNPVLLAVAIAPQRNTYGLIKSSGVFCVNVLAEGQEDIGKHFGTRSGRNIDKLKGIPHKLGYKNLPVLEGVKAVIMCELIDTHTAGDHEIFIGKIISLEETTGKKALIFRSKDYF
ncbi:MAG: flavin reductase family protein [Candidatus Omnitrophica bacterium]|nr:flavin reductase family protein [Candidatus Omnitrophota bacterium]